MLTLDEQIDHLYQLPLNEFTSARNALAKEHRGADATRVRTLQKPNIAAWGINQLYWRDRKTYDRVVDAAERLRTTHRTLLSGKSVDLHEVEAEHQEVVRAAAGHVRTLLSDAGETLSPATLTAVNETLDALPTTDEPPGRLTRPLKRMGFEALAGVVPGVRPGHVRPRPQLSLVRSAGARGRAEPPPPTPARAKEIAAVESKLRTADIEARQSREAAERAQRAVTRGDQQLQRLEGELAEARANLKTLETELARQQKAHERAEGERDKLREKLEKLSS